MQSKDEWTSVGWGMLKSEAEPMALLVFCVTQCLVLIYSSISDFYLCSGQLSDKRWLWGWRLIPAHGLKTQPLKAGKAWQLSPVTVECEVLAHIPVDHKPEDRKWGWLSNLKVYHYRHLLVRSCLQQVPHHFKTTPPARNPMSKYRSLWGTFYIKTRHKF